MEPITIVGVVIVNLALITYGIGIVAEQRSHKVTAKVLRFLQVGVVLDITATSFLAVMLTETGLAWKHRADHGDADVPGWLHWFSRLAYGWWCVAYVAGAALVMGG